MNSTEESDCKAIEENYLQKYLFKENILNRQQLNDIEQYTSVLLHEQENDNNFEILERSIELDDNINSHDEIIEPNVEIIKLYEDQFLNQSEPEFKFDNEEYIKDEEVRSTKSDAEEYLMTLDDLESLLIGSSKLEDNLEKEVRTKDKELLTFDLCSEEAVKIQEADNSNIQIEFTYFSQIEEINDHERDYLKKQKRYLRCKHNTDIKDYEVQFSTESRAAEIKYLIQQTFDDDNIQKYTQLDDNESLFLRNARIEEELDKQSVVMSRSIKLYDEGELETILPEYFPLWRMYNGEASLVDDTSDVFDKQKIIDQNEIINEKKNIFTDRQNSDDRNQQHEIEFSKRAITEMIHDSEIEFCSKKYKEQSIIENGNLNESELFEFLKYQQIESLEEEELIHDNERQFINAMRKINWPFEVTEIINSEEKQFYYSYAHDLINYEEKIKDKEFDNIQFLKEEMKKDEENLKLMDRTNITKARIEGILKNHELYKTKHYREEMDILEKSDDKDINATSTPFLANIVSFANQFIKKSRANVDAEAIHAITVQRRVLKKAIQKHKRQSIEIDSPEDIPELSTSDQINTEFLNSKLAMISNQALYILTQVSMARIEYIDSHNFHKENEKMINDKTIEIEPFIKFNLCQQIDSYNDSLSLSSYIDKINPDELYNQQIIIQILMDKVTEIELIRTIVDISQDTTAASLVLIKELIEKLTSTKLLDDIILFNKDDLLNIQSRIDEQNGKLVIQNNILDAQQKVYIEYNIDSQSDEYKEAIEKQPFSVEEIEASQIQVQSLSETKDSNSLVEYYRGKPITVVLRSLAVIKLLLRNVNPLKQCNVVERATKLNINYLAVLKSNVKLALPILDESFHNREITNPEMLNRSLKEIVNSYSNVSFSEEHKNLLSNLEIVKLTEMAQNNKYNDIIDMIYIVFILDGVLEQNSIPSTPLLDILSIIANAIENEQLDTIFYGLLLLQNAYLRCCLSESMSLTDVNIPLLQTSYEIFDNDIRNYIKSCLIHSTTANDEQDTLQSLFDQLMLLRVQVVDIIRQLSTPLKQKVSWIQNHDDAENLISQILRDYEISSTTIPIKTNEIMEQICKSEAAIITLFNVTHCNTISFLNHFVESFSTSISVLNTLLEHSENSITKARSLRSIKRLISRFYDIQSYIEDNLVAEENKDNLETSIMNEKLEKAKISYLSTINHIIFSLISFLYSLSTTKVHEIVEDAAILANKQITEKLRILSDCSCELLQFNRNKEYGINFQNSTRDFVSNMNNYLNFITSVHSLELSNQCVNETKISGTLLFSMVNNMLLLTTIKPKIIDLENERRLKLISLPSVPEAKDIAAYDVNNKHVKPSSNVFLTIFNKLNDNVKDDKDNQDNQVGDQIEKENKCEIEIQNNEISYISNDDLVDMILESREALVDFIQQILLMSSILFNMDNKTTLVHYADALCKGFNKIIKYHKKNLIALDCDFGQRTFIASEIVNNVQKALEVSQKVADIAEKEEKAQSEQESRYLRSFVPLCDALKSINETAQKSDIIPNSNMKVIAMGLLRDTYVFGSKIQEYFLLIRKSPHVIADSYLYEIADYEIKVMNQLSAKFSEIIDQQNENSSSILVEQAKNLLEPKEKFKTELANLTKQKMSPKETEVSQNLMSAFNKLSKCLGEAEKHISQMTGLRRNLSRNSSLARFKEAGKTEDGKSRLLTTLELNANVIKARIKLERALKKLEEIENSP
ncbi:hypothetical protein TRFO_30087 [Tritrichomonas foetus]|uniref:Uncharacterized protein n=1 Tax=Tritrichomonas foetus TaxID=1144522 RepID=A0A1J4JVG8_9EUKA|nr:hypothetical protein TRFO_30087 [Tritrichomonas foetus]|eukprot:OHT02722.1 hypothetical protein TRFO_30087 [Tritrichomonas foetus]